ncbi:TlpA family protein disulfide reductase [Pedobacter sandarakinus]|uniref:TlpA family protein disulfide reductase n=1 Tax=Pedobacter sandarakinus TaxID=353156 RepID=UPI002247F705|nr:TlpA disulfide reductase family protein [Pedobacter sandarakinus]MCX2576195.1 TlpA disulfide reductase family protein [Pedobacter sandarakinus]
MKKLTLLLILVTLANLGFGQYNVNLHVSNFNGFQRTHEKNPDSALFFLRNLAALDHNSTDDLLHNSFAQEFLEFDETKLFENGAFLESLKKHNVTVDSARKRFKEKRKNAYIILEQIKHDANTEIRDNAYGISHWVDAQDNLNNTEKLRIIGNEYLKYLTQSTDFYSQRKARYGLLIAKVMYNNEKLRSNADLIIQRIYQNLKDHQIGESSNISRSIQEQRSWYRYMLAYCNFILSQNPQLDKDEKLTYLKFAFQYSPDALDKSVKHAYFYDMIFLFGDEKSSFEDDYIAVLGNDADKLDVMMTVSMTDPSYKAKAKALFKDQEKFKDVWLEEFNKKAKPAPIFALKQIDGKQYSLEQSKGSWTLIDFWGTWCEPCRREHPDLQKVYNSAINGEMPKLNLITIASRDTESAVKAYLKNFGYSFPVIMSDTQIETSYHVSSWPSKFLVSPQGRYIVIPFGVDWRRYISEYIN